MAQDVRSIKGTKKNLQIGRMGYYHSRWFQPRSRSLTSILHEGPHPRSGWSWKPSHWSPQRSNREVWERKRRNETLNWFSYTRSIKCVDAPLQSLTWVQAVWSGCPVGWSGRWPGFLCGCRTGWAGLEHVLMSSQSCLSRHMHPHSDWSPNYSQYS